VEKEKKKPSPQQSEAQEVFGLQARMVLRRCVPAGGVEGAQEDVFKKTCEPPLRDVFDIWWTHILAAV
jgi:hypothetical protein